MASRGILGRVLRMRWTRAAALLGVCALAVQSARLPILLTAEAATCCCPHRTAEDVCSCPVCAHQRMLNSGQPLIETCGSAPQAAAIAAPEAAVLSPRTGQTLPSSFAAAPPRVVLPPPEPAVDVPTPPPLARG